MLILLLHFALNENERTIIEERGCLVRCVVGLARHNARMCGRDKNQRRVFGEAPKTAGEGARSPQNNRLTNSYDRRLEIRVPDAG